MLERSKRGNVREEVDVLLVKLEYFGALAGSKRLMRHWALLPVELRPGRLCSDRLRNISSFSYARQASTLARAARYASFLIFI
jgi:hypothetical protein